jgi:hypothetical protein
MQKHLTFSLALLTLLCTSAHAQLPSYLPADGLVGWWPFNGNANDESGNGNDGTVNGATLTEDRFANSQQAYSFDGSGIEVPMTELLHNLPVRTFSCWFLANGGQSGGRIYETTYLNGGIGMINGQMQNWYYNGPYHCNTPYFNAGALQTWHSLVYICDASIGQARVYLDGEMIVENMGDPYNAPQNWQNAFMRFGRGAQNEYFNGKIDDIAIYNRALTPQEIQNLYSGTNETVDTGNGAAPLPQGIPYQAAARDAQGQVIADAPVSVRFSLHEGAVDGAVSYSETHALTTNGIGLFNTEFGNGTPEQSAFDSINWAATTKFLQVEIDLGDGYVDMGTTQLLSVPYAFRSDEAARIKNAGLPIFADNTAALAGGLVAGEMYRTATGDLNVVY